MKICQLKLRKDLWPFIVSGQKWLEVRKMNKSFIETGDVIRFVDMDTGEHIGYARVKLADADTPSALVEGMSESHYETRKFIEENYMSEETLMVYVIEPIWEVM